MPCASAIRRASPAGSWPGSSPSGRLYDDCLQSLVGNRGLAQHFDRPTVHRAQLVAQRAAFLGQPDVDRAAVVHRALLAEIAVFDHLLDVIRDIRAKVAAAQRELAD